MAGLFLCAWDFLGDYLGYLGYLNYLDYLDSIVGVNLEFLGFQLSSIWDSISNPFASVWAPSGIPLLPLLPLLPSELHLSSIWDSISDPISDPFASV